MLRHRALVSLLLQLSTIGSDELLRMLHYPGNINLLERRYSAQPYPCFSLLALCSQYIRSVWTRCITLLISHTWNLLPQRSLNVFRSSMAVSDPWKFIPARWSSVIYWCPAKFHCGAHARHRYCCLEGNRQELEVCCYLTQELFHIDYQYWCALSRFFITSRRISLFIHLLLFGSDSWSLWHLNSILYLYSILPSLSAILIALPPTRRPINFTPVLLLRTTRSFTK